tara:strand:- start:15777 stop:15998 length:222 start_codon:yes stop_codon:yes gene_type:complete
MFFRLNSVVNLPILVLALSFIADALYKIYERIASFDNSTFHVFLTTASPVPTLIASGVMYENSGILVIFTPPN